MWLITLLSKVSTQLYLQQPDKLGFGNFPIMYTLNWEVKSTLCYSVAEPTSTALDSQKHFCVQRSTNVFENIFENTVSTLLSQNSKYLLTQLKLFYLYISLTVLPWTALKSKGKCPRHWHYHSKLGRTKTATVALIFLTHVH